MADNILSILFIGLGAMGSGMAANLAKTTHKILTFDLDKNALARAKDNGCTPVASVQAGVMDADVVISMLPNGAIVRAVYDGENGVFANAKAGALFIDCSTISVDDARYLISKAKNHGFDMLDAPVSGGVGAAESGALTFMVGGDELAFERAKSVLQPMAKQITHVGKAGNGQAAKICNNMLLAVSMIGVCEAFILAQKLGLDEKKFFDVATTSSGQCWSLSSYAPVKGLVETAPSNRDFKGGFAASLMLKDIGLALEAAKANGFDPAMALKANELYSEYVVNEGKNHDFSGIINMLRQS